MIKLFCDGCEVEIEKGMSATLQLRWMRETIIPGQEYRPLDAQLKDALLCSQCLLSLVSMLDCHTFKEIGRMR